MRVDQVAVVVPARDERARLPGCLRALRVAASRISQRVQIVVVLDRCVDGTELVVPDDLRIVRSLAGNVGVARAAGLTHAIGGVTDAARSLERLWLATTDADSRVPADWLDRQLRYAAQGWDAVAGTVRVESWRERPGWVARAFESRYALRDGHDHVHGANLGVHAPAYVRCGGMPPAACGEDHALVQALVRAGYAVRKAADLPVVTSARRDARAAGGFGHYLSALREPSPS